MKVIVSVDNFAAIDLKHGGKPIGGLLKKDALKAWGASKGVTVMDLDERGCPFSFQSKDSQSLANLVRSNPCPQSSCWDRRTSQSSSRLHQTTS